MRSRVLKIAMIVIIVLLTVGCDQAAKGIARSHLAGRGTVFLVGNLFVLHYVENEGAFLSLGEHLPTAARTIVFIAFPLLVLGIMIGYIIRKGLANVVLLAGFSLVTGGGFGNLIDRITRGGRVSDFMILRTPWISSGIFNVADLAIMAGCLLLLVSSLREERGKRPPSGSAAPAP
jgi:signal peptidase II